ncbi:MAG TPA: hypothetical protein VGR57_14965 [Ktedonobacterales bacterium]|nr:hypothetical protein [Ktedonobacterales bacterium]
MPTHEELERFLREFARLSVANQDRFILAMKHMVSDVRAGRPFRPGLRIKKVQGQDDIFEMTWAPDGRATFQYGTSPRQGEMHIIWRRIGGHAILKNP